MTILLAVACGLLSGFVLGLIGGGGSILATPLLLYVVRIGNPHMAIGTSAVAVAAAALFNFAAHAGAGHVRWRSALVFAVVGVAGALLGATIGKAVDGQKLLVLFALLMIVVGVQMLRRPDDPGTSDAAARSDLVVAALAFLAGTASGFFGIGGGFLIVPCLLFATDMPMVKAIGSSLLAVAAFSIATAATYAQAGLVDWPVAGWFVLGGIAGGTLGTWTGSRFAARKGMLRKIFALFIFAAAAYTLAHSLGAILEADGARPPEAPRGPANAAQG